MGVVRIPAIIPTDRLSILEGADGALSLRESYGARISYHYDSTLNHSNDRYVSREPLCISITVYTHTHRKAPVLSERRLFSKNAGDYLFFRGLVPQVPSAMEGLTTVFGMGTGVPPPVSSPANY